jgi:hypothetical protein
MNTPTLLTSLFVESYTKVKEHTKDIAHTDSLRVSIPGTNCMHWVIGHIVVARCNFLMLFDTPSIWDWPTCELFIPGSTPTPKAAEHIDYATILADLDRTQDQLMAALAQVSEADLEIERDGQTVGEQLATYAAHESYHAGQLQLLRQALSN